MHGKTIKGTAYNPILSGLIKRLSFVCLFRRNWENNLVKVKLRQILDDGRWCHIGRKAFSRCESNYHTFMISILPFSSSCQTWLLPVNKWQAGCHSDRDNYGYHSKHNCYIFQAREELDVQAEVLERVVYEALHCRRKDITLLSLSVFI